ncbi:MAG: hypothetical protein ACUVRU_03665 [Anaerolineae bacterium]
MTIAIQRHGGIALGAFERGSGRMIGFALSFLAPSALPGAANGLSHHSHMTAVAPEWQNQNIGMMLKLAQRQAVLARGINLITWTYDPLEARNARLNIHKLGAICRVYHRDYYGEMPDELNAGIATDRFEVEWWLDDRPLINRPHSDAGLPHSHALKISGDANSTGALGSRLEIDIPINFQSLKRSDLNLAKAWRMRSRLQFEDAFSRGYVVVDFIATPSRAYYILECR